MSVTAIVPVRSFRLAKLRLATALGDADRQRLGRAMAGHTVQLLADAGVAALIVSSDDEVREWAMAMGLGIVDDPGTGLNAACDAGVLAADEARWVVVHSDMPLSRRSDFDLVLGRIDEGREVIAPSSDGGTSMLSARTGIRFRYGPGSFKAHLSQMKDPVVIARTGLLHDLDTPDDLQSALRHPMGSWLAESIGRLPNGGDAVY